MENNTRGVMTSDPSAHPPTAEISVLIEDPARGTAKATVQTDAMMSLLLIILAAFGVIAMALYAVLLALKSNKRK